MEGIKLKIKKNRIKGKNGKGNLTYNLQADSNEGKY
jgi:hypothetical protein